MVPFIAQLNNEQKLYSFEWQYNYIPPKHYRELNSGIWGICVNRLLVSYGYKDFAFCPVSFYSFFGYDKSGTCDRKKNDRTDLSTDK